MTREDLQLALTIAGVILVPAVVWYGTQQAKKSADDVRFAELQRFRGAVERDLKALRNDLDGVGKICRQGDSSLSRTLEGHHQRIRTLERLDPQLGRGRPLDTTADPDGDHR